MKKPLTRAEQQALARFEMLSNSFLGTTFQNKEYGTLFYRKVECDGLTL
jgi:hypothetical protein